VTGPSRKTILIADDDRSIGRMLRVLLTSEGYDVQLATDGRQALEIVAAAEPDLVLLDLQMPDMDGRTFLREFRRLGRTAPVVVVSAYNAEQAMQELGATAALSKPFNPDLAIEIVRSSLQPPASLGETSTT
jgi:CheY-like chemotaxis protein